MTCRVRPSSRATSTVSMAPRTLLPWRTSGCTRVARTNATASRTRRSSRWRRSPSPPVRCSTISRSRDSSWYPDGKPAETVVDAHGDAHRPHVVERVHRGDQPERGFGGDRADPRDGQPAVTDGGEQSVERVLGAPVELLDVEESAQPHGLDQGSVDEILGQVSLAQHAVGCVVPTSFPVVRSAFPSTNMRGTPQSAVMARSMVVLLVPGGPSRSTSRPAVTAARRSSSSRGRPTTPGVLA